jgi:MFS family permease
MMRLILGIGESVMVPAFSKIFSFHLPEHCRGVANGVPQGAVRFGPAVGSTLGAGLQANISTTMNVYGKAFMKAKRKTNTSVVRRVLLQDHTK